MTAKIESAEEFVASQRLWCTDAIGTIESNLARAIEARDEQIRAEGRKEGQREGIDSALGTVVFLARRPNELDDRYVAGWEECAEKTDRAIRALLVNSAEIERRGGKD